MRLVRHRCSIRQVANDSSTGGPLAPLPSPAPAPLTGLALNNFLQGWVVGITGLDGTFVRPRWQPEPPIIPDAAIAWCAIGIRDRRGDAFPFIGHDGDGSSGNGFDQIIRNEELDLLCSFYDLGSNGMADLLAELMRDGAVISQNREVLKAQNFDIGFVGDVIPVASLLKSRWLYRVDLPIQVRRQVVRQYPVLNILSAVSGILTDTGLGLNIAIGHPIAGELLSGLPTDLGDVTSATIFDDFGDAETFVDIYIDLGNVG